MKTDEQTTAKTNEKAIWKMRKGKFEAANKLFEKTMLAGSLDGMFGYEYTRIKQLQEMRFQYFELNVDLNKDFYEASKKLLSIDTQMIRLFSEEEIQEMKGLASYLKHTIEFWDLSSQIYDEV